MSMDATDHLKDQLVDRYRRYLGNCSLSELAQKLEWLLSSATDAETAEQFLIDEILYRDYSGHSDDEFLEQIGGN